MNVIIVFEIVKKTRTLDILISCKLYIIIVKYNEGDCALFTKYFQFKIYLVTLYSKSAIQTKKSQRAKCIEYCNKTNLKQKIMSETTANM